MTTINLSAFPGRNFNDVYKFIMQQQEISYKLIIPRGDEISGINQHFMHSMDFGCAAYIGHLLAGLSTDFSYTVPSPYKQKPFEFLFETTEPEKLVDLLFVLLGEYNLCFTEPQESRFLFKAAQYYLDALEEPRMDAAAQGLVAIAHEQFLLSQALAVPDSYRH